MADNKKQEDAVRHAQSSSPKSGAANTDYTPKHTVKQASQVKLEQGNSLLASIRMSTNPNKIMLEFCEAIANPQSGVNVAALLNKSDERFNAPISIRRAWMAAELKDVHVLGITKDMIEAAKKAVQLDDKGKVIDSLPVTVDILNPKVAGADGKPKKLVIQLDDRTDAGWDEYSRNNPEARAKQFRPKNAPQTLYFVKYDEKGQPHLIFQKKTVVTEDVRRDKVITSDARITWEEFRNNGVTAVSMTEALNGPVVGGDESLIQDNE